MIAQIAILVLAIAAACCEGPKHTDARWLHWATKLEKGVARAPKWSRRPRLQRRALQALFMLALGETVLGWFTARHTTVLAIAAAGAVLALCWLVWAYFRVRAHAQVIGRATLREALHPAVLGQWWNHRLGCTSRLRHTLAPELGITPSHVKVAPDRSEAVIRLPYTFAGHAHQRLAVESAASTILHREGLAADWSKLHGRKPQVVFGITEPPPSELYWEGRIAAAVAAKKRHELVIGIGHKGQLVKTSLESDSPHLGIGMGSGAGKSNLAAFWLVQRLMDGDIAIILDGKRTSHPWAFKDMDANYDLLPNVAYARRIDDIHNMLVYLGQGLAERNERAEQVINAKGKLLGGIGDRWFILAEELNFIVPMLKIYWQRERERLVKLAKEGLCEMPPRQSPALMALAAISFAGRFVLQNIIFLGQRLDADVFGCSGSQGGAVRGNVGVRCLARYDEPAWKLQAPGSPMPPSPSVVGRIQAWIGGDVSECQVPFMDHKSDRSILRELAVSGTVTPCPVGMPGRSQSVSVLDVPAITQGADQGSADLGRPPPRPANWVTISDAYAAGAFGGRTKAAVQRASTRPGFPAPVGREGVANLYDLDDLLAMQTAKELVR